MKTKIALYGLMSGLLVLAASAVLTAPASRAQTLVLNGMRAAAEAGDAGSQNALGLAYENGQFSEVDLAQSVTWFQKSADQGNPCGERNLGLMFAEGKGVKQDFTEAVIWLGKAADQNVYSAQNSLGMLYIEGKGVPQDLAQGVKWLGNTHLGEHALRQGSKVDEDLLRFDFADPGAVGAEELSRIEAEVNERILEGEAVRSTVMPLAEARRSGAMMSSARSIPTWCGWSPSASSARSFAAARTSTTPPRSAC